MKKAVVYARQSFTSGEESISIESQIERCKAWAEANGVEIVGVFKDVNTSSELYPDNEEGHAYCSLDTEWQKWNNKQLTRGRKKYKKGLAEAFSCIKENKIDYFICNEKTRIYRNPSTLSLLESFILSFLKEHGVSIVEVEFNKIDSLSSNIEMALNRLIMDWKMNELEMRKEQSIRSKEKLIEKGIVFSNAFGVVWKDKKISFDEEKGKAIKFIFDSIIEGKTYGEILYELNRKYIHLAEGKSFYLSSIYNIVFNTVYSGVKTTKDGRQINIQNMEDKPLVSLARQLKAIEIIKSNKGKAEKKKCNQKNISKHFLPYSGLLTCGYCGRRMHMRIDNGVVYLCPSQINKLEDKCSTRIRMNFLSSDEDFLMALQPLFILKIEEHLKEIEQLNTSTADEKNLMMDIKNIESRQKIITEQFSEGKISSDVFFAVNEKINLELTEKKNALKHIQDMKVNSTGKFIEKLHASCKKIENSNELLNEDEYRILVRETIQDVQVFDEKIKIVLFDGNSFNLPRVKIRYTTLGIPFGKAMRFLTKNTEEKRLIVFYVKDKIERKTLLETDNYKIIIETENEIKKGKVEITEYK